MTDPERVDPAIKTAQAQFVEFELADQRYAVAIDQIREIVIPTPITPLPGVTTHVEGVSNLRGEIIPVINLRSLFGLDAQACDALTRTIVVHVGSRTMGLTVDNVTGVLRLSADAIRPAPEAVAAAGVDYITSLAKVDNHLTILLDAERLLAIDRLQLEDPVVLPTKLTE